MADPIVLTKTYRSLKIATSYFWVVVNQKWSELKEMVMLYLSTGTDRQGGKIPFSLVSLTKSDCASFAPR